MQGLPLFAARRRNIFLYVVLIALPVVFLVTMLSQSVFAQNTFVITDGDQVIVHTTYASDPAMALNEAGLDVDPDEYYTTQSEEGVYDITVTRDDSVTVFNCGEEMKVLIQDKTIGDLLTRAGVPTGDGYLVSCPITDKPVDGMTILVDHVVVNEEVYTVEIPFGTSTVEDPNLPAGEERIMSEGIVGQMLYTAHVEYRNAAEISRTVTDTREIRPVQNRVVAVGTGEAAAVAEEKPAIGPNAQLPLIGEDVIVLPTGEVLNYYMKDSFEATAYTQYDEGCDNITACQTQVRWGVVAVDPTVIPYGTRMFIINEDGSFVYGIATAEDCGSAIKGNRLDLFMHTLEEAFGYGRHNVTVYFLGEANRTF
jgi:3D (Asp-Asp-Asp) domain-containing protein